MFGIYGTILSKSTRLKIKDSLIILKSNRYLYEIIWK